jgi:ABC-type phosphate/phosphonate transport system ATPase subunit
VISADPAERAALLDVVTGRRIPDEGRVWLLRVPLMRTSASRVRVLGGEVDPASTLIERRSLFWNALAPTSGPRTLGGLLRLPRRRERLATTAALERVGLRARIDEPVGVLGPFDRMRFLLARALARRPRYLVVREADVLLGRDEVANFMALLRLVAREDRLAVVVSLAAPDVGRPLADRLLVLGDGLLLFHGRAEALLGIRARERAGLVGT